MVDRDGYEEKMKELNGKVIPGVSSSSSRGLIVEVCTALSAHHMTVM